MELRHIDDYKSWLKEIKKRGIKPTFIPLRFGKWRPLGMNDAGAWIAPTIEEVNSKVRKK